jgi:hypothetical protein
VLGRSLPTSHTMHWTRSTVCAIALASATVAPAAREQRGPARTFDAEPAGQPPAGFTFAAMRQPGPGTWTLRRQGPNGYIVHEADASAMGVSLAILTAAAEPEFVVSARLRLAGGTRAGGLVWRYRDEHNYHAVVLDLSKGELVMYRVAGGNRVRLEVEDDLELDLDAWHTLKIAHDDDRIRVTLGGIRVFDEREARDGGGGKQMRLGLIAAGSAEVWFDDLRLGFEDARRREGQGGAAGTKSPRPKG